jgi:predicted O-methyltransferase YrrM
VITMQEPWFAVDDYINDLFVPADPLVEAGMKAAEDAGIPAIQVSPAQGKMLSILAQAIGARSILEIGTLWGYSSIWLGRALAPGGSLVTLEADPKHAQVALANLARAGLDAVVEVRLGPALESLPRLAAEGRPPFDMVFIDADKSNTTAYFEWALKLTRPGGLIIADNVVRDGAVADPHSRDASVVGARQFNAALAAEDRVSAVVVQTVGSKGYDGFAIAVVKGAT